MYEAALRAQLAQAAASLASAAETVARCQQALATADGEVRTLEKLRDRQHDAFRHAQERAESKHLDEVAARMHGQSFVTEDC